MDGMAELRKNSGGRISLAGRCIVVLLVVVFDVSSFYLLSPQFGGQEHTSVITGDGQNAAGGQEAVGFPLPSNAKAKTVKLTLVLDSDDMLEPDFDPC